MTTYCTCWIDYPNPNHRKTNGKWLCVDCYKPIRKGDGRKVKTKCVKAEKEEPAT